MISQSVRLETPIFNLLSVFFSSPPSLAPQTSRHSVLASLERCEARRGLTPVVDTV
jgi:hypothetical protein